MSEARVRDSRSFPHSGSGLVQMADWILQQTGSRAQAVSVAIEVPHGPVVEFLMGRCFTVYAINPKQVDRFRDRFSPAGAKDDRRDARVLADAIRTDGHRWQQLGAVDSEMIQLREFSRLGAQLTRESDPASQPPARTTLALLSAVPGPQQGSRRALGDASVEAGPDPGCGPEAAPEPGSPRC